MSSDDVSDEKVRWEAAVIAAKADGTSHKLEEDLGMPWGRWADGRLWRLKRGKHYDADSRLVIAAARSAAKQMGKAVRTSKEQSGKLYEYVWVQFADGEIFVGEDCPVCGATELERLHPAEARCPTCKSVLILKEP